MWEVCIIMSKHIIRPDSHAHSYSTEKREKKRKVKYASIPQDSGHEASIPTHKNSRIKYVPIRFLYSSKGSADKPAQCQIDYDEDSHDAGQKNSICVNKCVSHFASDPQHADMEGLNRCMNECSQIQQKALNNAHAKFALCAENAALKERFDNQQKNNLIGLGGFLASGRGLVSGLGVGGRNNERGDCWERHHRIGLCCIRFRNLGARWVWDIKGDGSNR